MEQRQHPRRCSQGGEKNESNVPRVLPVAARGGRANDNTHQAPDSDALLRPLHPRHAPSAYVGFAPDLLRPFQREELELEQTQATCGEGWID